MQSSPPPLTDIVSLWLRLWVAAGVWSFPVGAGLYDALRGSHRLAGVFPDWRDVLTTFMLPGIGWDRLVFGVVDRGADPIPLREMLFPTAVSLLAALGSYWIVTRWQERGDFIAGVVMMTVIVDFGTGWLVI